MYINTPSLFTALLLICFSGSVLSESISSSSRPFFDGRHSEAHLNFFAEIEPADDVLPVSDESSKRVLFHEPPYGQLERGNYEGMEVVHDEEEEIDDTQAEIATASFPFSVDALDRGT